MKKVFALCLFIFNVIFCCGCKNTFADGCKVENKISLMGERYELRLDIDSNDFVESELIGYYINEKDYAYAKFVNEKLVYVINTQNNLRTKDKTNMFKIYSVINDAEYNYLKLIGSTQLIYKKI